MLRLDYEIIQKQRQTERMVREHLKKHNLEKIYTRKELSKIMRDLYPYTNLNYGNRAFMGMTKARMIRHIEGLAILKRWN